MLSMQKIRFSPTSSLLVVSFAIWFSVSLRWIFEFIEQSHPYLWLLSTILAVYGLLLGLQPFITKKSPLSAYIYLGVQTALILGAMLLYYELDFFALLFLPLGGQAMLLFPRKTALVWIAVFGISITVGQTIQFGWPGGLSYTFLYLAGLFFVASFSILIMRANEARLQSDQLLEELQRANRQLQEYAGQAEELATAKERNRLARELHDSVAQTLYGLTLQAEAASRKLLSNQTDEVADYLDEIRDSAQETLKETRLLIFELRPPILEQEGLGAALQARLESVESRSGLKTQTHLQELDPLPGRIESALYGISKEVLNNILKHAHATEVTVSLGKKNDKIILRIRDNGIGFDLDSVEHRGGLGLKGMRERAEQIRGDLRISSGENGTQVILEVPYA